MNHHETPEIDDTLNALRDELAGVAPSPEFAARVRQRIDAAGETPGGSRLFNWRWIAPVTVVAAVVIAVFAIPRPRSEAPEQVSAKAPTKAADPLVNLQKPATNNQRGGSVKFEVRTSKFGPPAATVAVAAGAEPAASAEAPFPEVLTNQPEILRALWTRFNSGAAAVESTAAPLPADVSEIVVPPVEVSPVVVKWMVEPPVPPVPPGTSPIIRRVTAETAERSEK